MGLSDGEWVQRADVWGIVLLSVALTVLLPTVTWRKFAKEELLREKVLLSSRGGVLTGMSVLSVVLVVAGAVYVLLATRYPFAWATAAMVASALVSVVIYTARYIRVRQRMVREIAREQALPAADRGPDAPGQSKTPAM